MAAGASPLGLDSLPAGGRPHPGGPEGGGLTAEPEYPAEPERRACPAWSRGVCGGVEERMGVGGGGDHRRPQAGDPVGSGIHFLSWRRDRRPKPDRAWPGQPHSHPHPCLLPWVELHLRCPERGRENHSLKGPVPLLQGIHPPQETSTLREVPGCVLPLPPCIGAVHALRDV